MQIGDLICYNAAGQKYKSLGLVIKKRYDNPCGLVEVLIHWVQRGEVLPKDMNLYGWQWTGRTDYDAYEAMKSGSNPCLWHEAGDWLEVVSCK